MNIPSILVVDDQPDNFDVIETFLSEQDYTLHYAAGGEEAIASLDLLQPDIILLDVMMPGIDGIEVCRRIKAMPQWQPVPIIMVTALNAKKDLAECLAAGADDFMSKPVNAIELRARVNCMLRIKKQYDSLQALLQLREDMVNMIVHDLRNPVTGILLSAEVLRLPNISAERMLRKVEQITISGKQLQSSIDSILLLAKLESGTMVLDYTEVDFCALCMSAITDFKPIASQKTVTLVSKLPAPSSLIKLDATVFRRVLDNLLSNAIKFSPSNSQITLEAEYLEAGHAKVKVADLGPGVPDTLKQSIFEKYEIGTRMQNVSQTGLGLAFCKMAIEAHQGTITVEDNHPRGSIFTVLV
ncbi:hybrid sensor histidine kinase/response regulator [Calothrix sp. PCC 6303]|uniref:hybrid sensor histidine kinase/response regulator n=1 Tax=Calothrix sp. PCC 6303 TaxID=1170562 RepID=UPI0002A02121|nr:hybrid sensor histidine kinase/response regulator [Calothrix sp. PCC 6303]AFZ02616.1 response regulator receiver sensor signal transduction histidine kinase [Calothrix sp. PCC 6303]